MFEFDVNKFDGANITVYSILNQADINPVNVDDAVMTIVTNVVDAVVEHIELVGGMSEADLDHANDDITYSLVPVYTRNLAEEFHALSVWDEELIPDASSIVDVMQHAVSEAYRRMVSAAFELAEV